MRTIFITPLLWKRFDRAALRRGEEGQALVLIAFVVIAMVAMVGLAIDGGLGYLEAQRLQRAADAAALAGVPWVPDNRAVADSRAQLSAESNGASVACYYDSAKTANSNYNQRCKRADWPTVQQFGPNERYYFESSQPQGQGIRYRVTLGKMQQRFFLGVLGFPNYPILRSATAEYSRLIKFGSSINYFGTNGVLYDHYMRCDPNNPSLCDGNGPDLDMYGAVYQRFVIMRCDQPKPPSPCMGGFWGHIAGPDLVHSSGDAYNPIRDGAKEVVGGTGPLGGVKVNLDSSKSNMCTHTSDPSSWFVTSVNSDTSKGTCTQSSGGVPIRNQDYHPDSSNQQQGFGYEIAIDVNKDFIYSYSETQADITKHTNLNVSIYDGAISDLGDSQTWATSDNFQPSGNANSTRPYNSFYLQNQIATNATWFQKQFTTGPNSSRSNVDGKLFPDSNNLNLTYNDMRTRLTLYGPPTIPSIPSTYGNVSGYKIGSFEITDMSVRRSGSDTKIGSTNQSVMKVQMPIEDGQASMAEYCYVIFDDVKDFWNNTPATTGTDKSPANGGTGPDYAYQSNGSVQPQSTRYAYVCPPGKFDWYNSDGTLKGTATVNTGDYRWNQIKGTPTARYGSNSLYAAGTGDRTIMTQILDTPGTTDIDTSPIVTGTLGTNGATLSNVDPSLAGVASIWNPPTSTYKQVVDPAQDCRRSATDLDEWPIDPLWGHNRIPFNMAYGDPLVNRAWITNTTSLGSGSTPVASGNLAGYYTLYYSFHGWRCDWDFDSNYTFNPLKNPNLPPSASNQSLSMAERLLPGVSPGQYDRAFVLGHPGLTANNYLKQVMDQVNVSTKKQGRELLPFGSTPPSYIDRDYGLQPYFHLTNVAWNNGNVDIARDASGNPYSNGTAPVRAGTYMLHIQVFGGSGANRYSVKAEYENAKPLTLAESPVYTITPVPQVYAITSMAIYANAANTSSAPKQNVIFDLAYIPPENAGTQAILELFDPGDVKGTLALQILKPSTWGPRLDTHGSSVPYPTGQYGQWKWTLPTGAPLTTRLTVCPYSLNVDALGLNANCFTNSLANTSDTWNMTVSDDQYYNDQWMLVSFTIPSAGEYANMKKDCDVNSVPENLCYYYQINYQLTGANAVANDTTTWQLVVQGQPVHLVV